MMSSKSKVSDAKVQSYELKFNFKNQSEKLIIDAKSSKDDFSYSGQIVANPSIDFDDIKQLLSEGQFKVVIKNEDLLKIKIGAMSIELHANSYSNVNELRQMVAKTLKKQQSLEATIRSQNDEIKKLKQEVQKMKKDKNQSPEMIKKLTQNQKTIAKQAEQINQILTQMSKLQNRTLKIQHGVSQVKFQSKNYQNNQISKSPSIKSQWDRQLKGYALNVNKQIIESSALKTKETTCYFGLLKDSFNLDVKEKKHWLIRINKKVGQILIGICLRKYIQNIGFKFNNVFQLYDPIDNGRYLVSSELMCFSTSSKEFNYQKTCFEFLEGDTIYCQYDPINRILNFINFQNPNPIQKRKKQSVTKFFIPIRPPPKNDAYHPCVGLQSTGDQLQLICED